MEEIAKCSHRQRLTNEGLIDVAASVVRSNGMARNIFASSVGNNGWDGTYKAVECPVGMVPDAAVQSVVHSLEGLRSEYGELGRCPLQSVRREYENVICLVPTGGCVFAASASQK